MKKYLMFAAFCVVLASVGIIKAEQGDKSTLGYNTPSGYSYWRVDSNGYLKPGVANLLDIGTAALPVRTLYNVNQVSTGYTQLACITIASLKTTTPAAVGQMYYCTDCATACKVVVSSGTAVFGFSLVTSSVTSPS